MLNMRLAAFEYGDSGAGDARAVFDIKDIGIQI